MGFKSTWIGEGERYSYGQMCIPTFPCKKSDPVKINFYSKGEWRCGVTNACAIPPLNGLTLVVVALDRVLLLQTKRFPSFWQS
jgi:hypothetical protein